MRGEAIGTGRDELHPGAAGAFEELLWVAAARIGRFSARVNQADAGLHPRFDCKASQGQAITTVVARAAKDKQAHFPGPVQLYGLKHGPGGVGHQLASADNALLDGLVVKRAHLLCGQDWNDLCHPRSLHPQFTRAVCTRRG